MADDTQRIEEENASLREQIEQVQQKRREGFARAEELSRSVSVQEERERLQRVLAEQERIFEKEEAARESIGSDEEPTNEAGLTPSTPYTYTPRGPIVSDDADKDDDHDVNVSNEEN